MTTETQERPALGRSSALFSEGPAIDELTLKVKADEMVLPADRPTIARGGSIFVLSRVQVTNHDHSLTGVLKHIAEVKERVLLDSERGRELMDEAVAGKGQTQIFDVEPIEEAEPASTVEHKPLQIGSGDAEAADEIEDAEVIDEDLEEPTLEDGEEYEDDADPVEDDAPEQSIGEWEASERARLTKEWSAKTRFQILDELTSQSVEAPASATKAELVALLVTAIYEAIPF